MRRLFTLALIFVMMFAFVSCSATSDIDNTNESTNTQAKNNDKIIDEGPVKGGVLNLFGTKPDTFNPLLTNNMYVQEYSRLIFDSLVSTDNNQKLSLNLAKHYEASPDGLEWTFSVRDNVYWHDNIPLTAEDVEFTFLTILDNKSNSIYKKNLQNVASVSLSGPYEFKVILNKVDSFTPELFDFPIIPKHYYEGEVDPIGGKNMSPIGTGPYKFKEYKDNEYIKLVVNDRWWKSKNINSVSTPYIGDIYIKIFDSSVNPATPMIKGEVDVATIDGKDGYGLFYSGRKDMTVKKYPGKNYEFIAFNLSRAILNEKGVRQAIASAINPVEIIKQVLPGEAVPADMPLIPGTWLNESNSLSYQYNVEKAKEILVDNGWIENEGVMHKTIYGSYMPLKLEILVNDDNDIRYKAANKISEQLLLAGIVLDVKRVSWDEEQSLISSKRFDMALIGSRITSIPDLSFLYSTSELYTGKNISGFSNRSVDEYFEQIRSEQDDSKKKLLYYNLKEVLMDEVPYVGLMFYNDIVIYNKRIKGQLSPSPWDKFSDISKWYIPF